MEVAKGIVENIVENEPRDVITTFKDAFAAGKKIKETAQAVLGPRNVGDLASVRQKPRK
jgi:phage FluMu gp28-like protein